MGEEEIIYSWAAHILPPESHIEITFIIIMMWYGKPQLSPQTG
jgi:hypothetical protein